MGYNDKLCIVSHKEDLDGLVSVQWLLPHASENTVSIEPDSLPVGSVPEKENRSMHLDYSHTIELPEERKSTRFTNIICRMAIFISTILFGTYDDIIIL